MCGDLHEGEPAEKLEVDHVGELGIDLGQRVEGRAHPLQFGRLSRGVGNGPE